MSRPPIDLSRSVWTSEHGPGRVGSREDVRDRSARTTRVGVAIVLAAQWVLICYLVLLG